MKRCAGRRDGPGKRREAATGPGAPGSEAAAKTFRRRREGIPDGYESGKADAVAEGPDNTTELLKKSGYGCPRFARMRRRCLSAPGYHEPARDRARLPQAGAREKPRKRAGSGPAAASAARKK